MQGVGPPAPAAGAAAAGAGGGAAGDLDTSGLRARRLLACLREADASDLRRPELARLWSAQRAQREHARALRELILGLVARRLRPLEVEVLVHRVAARAGLEAGLGAERRAEVVARLVQALDERAAGRLRALGPFRVQRRPEEAPLELRRVAAALAPLLAAEPGATGPGLDELRDAVCVIEGVVRKARGMLHVAMPLLERELRARAQADDRGGGPGRDQADLDRGVRHVNRLYDRAFGPRGPQQAPAYDMRAELRRPVWADSPRDRDEAFGASGGAPSPAGTPGASEGGAGGSDSDAETYASGYLRDGDALYGGLGSTSLRKELFGGAESWGEKCADARSVELGDAILFYEAAVGDIFDRCFKAALLAHAILTFKNAEGLGSLIVEEDIFDTACKMEGKEPSAAFGSGGEPGAKARVPPRAVLRRAFRMSFPGERDLRGVQALIDEQAKEASRREQGLEGFRQALAALQNLDAADFDGLARAAKLAVEPPAKKRKGTGPMPRSKRVLNLVNASNSKITEHFY